MESAILVQILNKTTCISLCADNLRKDRNPTLLAAMDKMVGQIGFFSPSKTTGVGET